MGILSQILEQLQAISYKHIIMWAIGALLIYLAIKKDMEPALLLPMGFGAILVNLPFSGALTQGTEIGALSKLFDIGIGEESGELFPLLLFIGIGAMIDFGPLLSNPKLLLFGAAAQFGIFFTLSMARLFGFELNDAASIAIIGAADGPTSIVVAKLLKSQFIGAIMDLCQERRGQYIGMEYMEETRALLKYELPLNEIIYDFFDALKSRSRGYASFDYELKGYEQSQLVKLDILINKETVDALSFIVFEGSAYERGRKMCEKLKDEIPKHLFEIPIQAAVGGKIIARETVRAMRKDVLAKCYGGDISRKKKLLEKQKEGKKRMRQVGNVEIPQKAFMSVLKLDEE